MAVDDPIDNSGTILVWYGSGTFLNLTLILDLDLRRIYSAPLYISHLDQLA